jgi:adenosylhomocysteine nucleosidase
MFHWLARYLIQNVAQEKVREAVMAAAQERVAEAMRGGQGGGEPPPCEVGVVFALEQESGGTEDLLAERAATKGSGFVAIRGSLAGRGVAVVRSGAGRDRAARATEALLAGHRPKWVISAGFTGGLDRRLARGDILLANEVVDESGRRMPIDHGVDVASLPDPGRVHVGRLLTLDRVIRLPRDKEELGRKHQALAVDMESLAVVEVCAARNVPVLVVRVVSDAVDDTLPADVERLVTQKTPAARWGAALGAVINRPGSLKDMLALQESALKATDRLARTLARIVKGPETTATGPSSEGSG